VRPGRHGGSRTHVRCYSAKKCNLTLHAVRQLGGSTLVAGRPDTAARAVEVAEERASIDWILSRCISRGLAALLFAQTGPNLLAEDHNIGIVAGSTMNYPLRIEIENRREVALFRSAPFD
jgi:hypothetical protein